MAWTVMWSGGAHSTAAIIKAAGNKKEIIAYNICPFGQEGHLRHLETKLRSFYDRIYPLYFELSDNARLHGRFQDLVALMTYPAYTYARDYTKVGHQGIIYGKKFESPARDKLLSKGLVLYGPPEDEVGSLLAMAGIEESDLCFE